MPICALSNCGCIHRTRARLSQIKSQHGWGRGPEPPPPISEKLLATDGFWEKKGEFSSGIEALRSDLHGTPIDGLPLLTLAAPADSTGFPRRAHEFGREWG